MCVAPMMGYTDRHFRYLLRLLSPSAKLYSEMITANALLARGPGLVRFEDDARRSVLQLGGSVPEQLAECARLGEAAGYTEINLNVGCPSPRVSSGRFGACLMAEPGLVAECVAAMRERVAVPVTIKCRLGIDVLDSSAFETFVARVEPHVDALVVHARIAILDGLSPEENREIPPLRYDWVHALAARCDDLPIVLNGGLRSARDAHAHAGRLAGVMLGRAIVADPGLLPRLDAADPRPDHFTVLRAYAEYARREIALGTPFAVLGRRALGLFVGQPGARAYRRALTAACHRKNGSVDEMLAAATHVTHAAAA